MYLNFPYQIDENGQSSRTGRSDHIRDMIRQVLFTVPGERVNRPTFGSGLHQLVFEPNNTELQATVQFLVRGALQEWLGEVIEVEDVQIELSASTLEVRITYHESGSPLRQEASFSKSF